MSELIHVLYLDDNRHDLELVTDALMEQHSEFDLTTTADRTEFDTLLKKEDWDIVLSDLNILGYSGIQVIQHVHDIAPETPVIIITGTGSEEMAAQAIKTGASDYVIKNRSHIQRLPETIHSVLQLTKAEKRRRQTQEILKQRERELVRAQEVAHIGSWTYDPAGQQPDWSDEMFRIFGRDPAKKAPPYAEHRKIIHPDDWHMFDSAVQRAVKEGFGYDLEIRVRRPDGEIRYVNTRCEPNFNSEGDVVELIGTTQNITDRKMSELALRQGRIFLVMLLDAIPIPVFYKGLDGKYLGVNKAFEDFFGKKRDDLIGKTAFDITNPDLARVYHTKDQELFRRGGRQKYESQILNAEGVLKEVLFNKATYTDDQGKIIGIIGTIIDITELKKMENQRRQAEEQLRNTQRLESIGQLAGGIAHDFNNMLSVILGYGQELMENSGLDDAGHEAVREIVEAGKRSASLTRQLLAFSRQQALQPEILSLNDIVQGMSNMLGRLIGEDIELNFELAGELDQVEVDPVQIEQVIINLAANARDAMPGGGKLTIVTANIEMDPQLAEIHGAASTGRYVMLSVSDTGCGMTEENREHVFEPFFTTKKKGKGTGLGLATVYGIVKQSNGSIRINSEPGQGSTFTIYLPTTTAKPSLKKAPEEVSSIRGSGETILVVEDEPSLRRLCARLLTALDYTLYTAAGPSEALALIEQEKLDPDLIITDVVMPEMSGKVMVERLRNHRPGLKVLYMSGYTDHAIFDHGVFDKDTPFLQKPFTKAKLGKTVREILDGHYGLA